MPHRSPLFALLLAEGLNALGAGIAIVALPRLVLEVSADSLTVGLTVAGVVLAGSALTPAIRGVQRRLGSWWTVVVLDLLAAVRVFLIQLYADRGGTGWREVALLLAGGAALSVAAALAPVARLRLLPALAERVSLMGDAVKPAGRTPEGAPAVRDRLRAVSYVAGIVLAAALAVLLSDKAALWLAGACFLQAAEAVFVLVPSATEETDDGFKPGHASTASVRRSRPAAERR
jgi:hypothetical protein